MQTLIEEKPDEDVGRLESLLYEIRNSGFNDVSSLRFSKPKKQYYIHLEFPRICIWYAKESWTLYVYDEGSRWRRYRRDALAPEVFIGIIEILRKESTERKVTDNDETEHLTFTQEVGEYWNCYRTCETSMDLPPEEEMREAVMGKLKIRDEFEWEALLYDAMEVFLGKMWDDEREKYSFGGEEYSYMRRMAAFALASWNKIRVINQTVIDSEPSPLLSLPYCSACGGFLEPRTIGGKVYYDLTAKRFRYHGGEKVCRNGCGTLKVRKQRNEPQKTLFPS